MRDPGTGFSLLTDDDLHYFAEGSHLSLADCLGAHVATVTGNDDIPVTGTYFAVWAPTARAVSVLGGWNGWEPWVDRLSPVATSGIWEGFVPGVGKGTAYKYRVISRIAPFEGDKADPMAVRSELPPATASIVWDLDYAWNDGAWMASRGRRNSREAPMAIYEVHLGSWRRKLDEGNRFLTYRELADELPDYVAGMGFTHVELMPVMEHPYYASWGYQVTGYFSATSRYGTPQDLMYLIDRLHQRGIGVILDWVPSHFPSDGHGLGFFDGTHLYEHADPRQGYHPDWESLIFNYGRPEVRSFLLSSALFWLSRYHADGIRVDAVASMLYLDYSRPGGAWVANEYGGRENLEAIAFLRRLNQEIYRLHPDVQCIAEESTSWPLVSRPPYVGGLGFGMKWDMGWMHDTLKYFEMDSIHRPFHHQKVTFRGMYQHAENFVLPFSHDEVVHGKGSLVAKMAGDEWRKFANLRAMLGWMYAQPGKKLLFMGSEFGQWREWAHEGSLEWHVLRHGTHAGVKAWVRDLNHLMAADPALHELDFEPAGFHWIDCSDADKSVVSLLRQARDPDDVILVACNFTPVPRHDYRIGVPRGGRWRELLNSDAEAYGGSGMGNQGSAEAEAWGCHGQPFSLRLTLPPLAVLFFKADRTPSAAELLEAYAAAQDRGVATLSWDALAALFHDDGELHVDAAPPDLRPGLTAGPFRGRRAIVDAFVEAPPAHAFLLGAIESMPRAARAPIALAAGPEAIVGTIELGSHHGRIARLALRAS